MRKNIYLLISMVILSVFCFLPVAVLAQSSDQLTIIDDAAIFGNTINKVEAAVIELESMGADVRIRTILTYGSTGNLDLYEAQLELENPSWLGQGGERKNNLIVIIIALEERETGLYYGSYWGDLFESEWLNVLDTMGMFFADGDYAAGVIAGLEEIQYLIKDKSSSNSWIIPLVILFLLASAVGVLFVNTYTKSRKKLAAIRQKALISKQGAALGINELIEKMQMLEIKVDVISQKITKDECASLFEGTQKAKNLVDRSSVNYSELAHSAGDPENRKLGEAELTVIEIQYGKILDKLRQAREEINTVESQISEIQGAVKAFPAKAEGVNISIEQVLEKLEELKNSGYKTDYITDLIEGSRSTLKHAQDIAAMKQFIAAMEFADEAASQVNKIILAIVELPQKKQQAEKAIPTLTERIKHVKDVVDDGRKVFDRLFLNYAESAWESIQGNGTEAENRIDWATEALNEARLTAVAKQQDWLKAMDMVNKGNNWLDEAESMMQSVSELETNLIEAQKAFPYEIDDAEADIEKAWDYIDKYDEDIRESLEDDLREAEKNIELARHELKQDKPDFFKVCGLAREANESADKILIQARNEHEAAERLRAKAVSAKRDAAAKISIAKEYIQDHNTAVKTQSKRYLTDAEDSLRLFDSVTDTKMKITLATKAEEAADKAYKLAQKNFNDLNITPVFIPFPFPGSTSSPVKWGTKQSNTKPSTTRRSSGGSSSWGKKQKRRRLIGVGRRQPWRRFQRRRTQRRGF